LWQRFAVAFRVDPLKLFGDGGVDDSGELAPGHERLESSELASELFACGKLDFIPRRCHSPIFGFFNELYATMRPL